MRAVTVISDRRARPSALKLAASCVVAGYAAALAGAALTGGWLFDASGRPIADDFISLWAAGRMALEGMATSAYDWNAHKAVQTAAIAQDFAGYFNWPYPPTYLLVAAPLSLLAFPVAQLVWMALTAPIYAAVAGRIADRPGAALAALAFPAAFWNFGCGQNGFLTAALLGGALAALRPRPALAGLLLGLLAYKPQLGVLIPIALVAGGHWRTAAVAAVTAVATAVASLAAFGPEPWIAFVASTAETSRAILSDGRADFAELLSPYGVTRWLGGGAATAWCVHGAVAAALAVLIWRVWRGSAPFSLKAALVSAAALLASPYLFVYDLAALAIPIAFLARDGASRGERNALACVCLLVMAGPTLGIPLAALAAPAVIGLTLKRLSRERRGLVREGWSG